MCGTFLALPPMTLGVELARYQLWNAGSQLHTVSNPEWQAYSRVGHSPPPMSDPDWGALVLYVFGFVIITPYLLGGMLYRRQVTFSVTSCASRGHFGLLFGDDIY
jgi:hypothetical protein